MTRTAFLRPNDPYFSQLWAMDNTGQSIRGVAGTADADADVAQAWDAFEVGDEIIEASAGDYVFGPRDIPHRFTVGDSGCRMLFIMVPGGMEDVIRATSEPAPTRTLPPPPEEEPSAEEIEGLKAIVREHGYELLV